MKVILIGYPGSQVIVPASKYLTNKYLPQRHLVNGWDIRYINYTGKVENWAIFLSGCLSILMDSFVILALDDYLIADYLDQPVFSKAMVEIAESNGEVVCVKLCQSTPEEHAEYPVTTQYTIWNREYLIDLLREVKDPWEFEIKGSKIFGKTCLHRPCLEYFTNSSISSRWEGVRLDGLKDEDIKYIKKNGLIT